MARLAFLEMLTEDKRVVDLWWGWGQSTGVNDSARTLRLAIDQLAASAGLENQESMRKIYEIGSELELEAMEGSLNPELVDIADDALAEFGLCLDRVYSLRKQMSAATTVFIRDTLELTWPWLTLELIKCFEYSALAIGSGSTNPLEKKAERKEAVASEGARRRRSHRATAIIRGRLPLDEEAEFQDGVGRCARWFYRNRLIGESIREIAKSDHCDRATVERGISEAEQILGIETKAIDLLVHE